MDDNERRILLEGLHKGDRESFNKIFRSFYAPLMRYCMRYVADADNAAEIVQDLFVKLWAGHETLSINTSLDAYLYRAVQNLSITYINKERAHAETNMRIYSEEGESADPSEEMQGNNLEASYQKVIAEMPEKRRQVFVMSRFDGLKYAEISEKLGLSVKTVEAHMSMALKQLRTGLKDYL